MISSINTSLNYGVSNAGMVHTAGSFHAPTVHIPSAHMPLAQAAATWAAAAHAPQRKRRIAAATDAFVNRGFV